MNDCEHVWWNIYIHGCGSCGPHKAYLLCEICDDMIGTDFDEYWKITETVPETRIKEVW